MKNKRLIYILLPVFFVILNFILKGLFLGSNSLGGDEPFSVYHAQMNVSGIIHQLTQGNNPPLYELILHFWIKCFGISEFAVRFPSLLFSSLTVWFIYKIGFRFFNFRVAIYASILFIFSAYQVVFAHEARSYALIGMLTAISMYYYLEIIVNKSNSNAIKALFLVANALLIYTHFFGFFVLFIQFFFVLFQPKLLREHYKFLLLFIGALLLVYSPNIPIILERFSSSTQGGTWILPPSGISELFVMFRRFANSPVGGSLMILILLIGYISFLIRRKEQEQKIQTKLMFCWFVIPLIFLFCISFWIPVFLDRYLMFLSIGGMLALAFSLDTIIQHQKFRYLLPSLICLIFILTAKPNQSNNRLDRDAVNKVKELQDEQTLVIVTPYFYTVNFAYYYDKSIFKNVNTQEVYKNMLYDLRKKNVICVDQLDELPTAQFNKVILLDVGYNYENPTNEFQRITERFQQIHKTHIEEIYDIYEFERK